MKRPSIFVARRPRAALFALLQSAAAAPALAATFPTFTLPTTMSPADMLLYGSVALLVIGVALRIIKGREGEQPAAGPDLRWWKNAENAES